jgi:hypothetical protein
MKRFHSPKKSSIRKARNIFEFFKSIVAVNLAVSALPLVFGGFDVFILVFLTIGFAASLARKEISEGNEYIFYHNNGLGKWQLWAMSFMLHLITVLLLSVAFVLFNRFIR